MFHEMLVIFAYCHSERALKVHVLMKFTEDWNHNLISFEVNGWSSFCKKEQIIAN